MELSTYNWHVPNSSSTEEDDDRVKGPIDYMVVLHSDLNENSTRFERLISAPSYDQQELMWLVWAILAFLCAAVGLVVFFGILTSPIRKKTFNLYLLFLMFPDIFFSCVCFFTCAQNYRLGYYSSLNMCRFQSFYVMFAVASNSWLNAVICKQVHNMLICVKRRKAYRPPPTMVVIWHCGLAYLWSFFVVSWTLFGVPLEHYGIRWWPLKPTLSAGVGCLPLDYDQNSSIFFYCVFVPCLMGIPLVYTMYLLYDIWYKEMLPYSGKQRQLTLFMIRLMVVFLVMWTPAIFFSMILGQFLGPWSHWLGGTWVHLEGAVSAIFSLTKPDVYQAIQKFARCTYSTIKAPLLDKKMRREVREAKKYAKLLEKTKRELALIENQLSSARSIGTPNQYTRELEDLVQELQETKDTAEKRAAPLVIGLLEDFGDEKRAKGFSLEDLPSIVDVGPQQPSKVDSLVEECESDSPVVEALATQDLNWESENEHASEAFAANELDPEIASFASDDKEIRKSVSFAKLLEEYEC